MESPKSRVLKKGDGVREKRKTIVKLIVKLIAKLSSRYKSSNFKAYSLQLKRLNPVKNADAS